MEPPPLDSRMSAFSNWAVVARKDNTGFGRQAADARRVLGIGFHFVCPSDRIEGRPPEGPHEEWLLPDMDDGALGQLLSKVEGILFFETYRTWHPRLLQVAKQLGVRTVCVPNWEWFRGDDPLWELCDLFACPTRFTVGIVQRYGWRQTLYLPWALDLGRFKPRQIEGPARLFIHNAGLVDPDDRKGTRDTIEAFKRVGRRDIRLLVRVQKEVPLPELDDRIEVRIGDLEDPAELYSIGDCAIQPSKMEGIGFMVIEPVCAGMPVITTDAPPMNEFVLQREMLARPRWFKRKAFPTQWIKHAFMRLPRQGALAAAIDWCAENDLRTLSHENRQHAESLFGVERLKELWTGAVAHL